MTSPTASRTSPTGRGPSTRRWRPPRSKLVSKLLVILVVFVLRHVVVEGASTATFEEDELVVSVSTAAAATATAAAPNDDDGSRQCVADVTTEYCNHGETDSTTTTTTTTTTTEDNANASSSWSSGKSVSSTAKTTLTPEFGWKRGSLRVSDLPDPTAFDDFVSNRTVSLPSGEYWMATGSVVQINQVDNQHAQDLSAEVSLLKQALPRKTLDQLLQLLRSYDDYDVDPDTVDGMPTYEIFVDSVDLEEEERRDPNNPGVKINDIDPRALRTRRPLRKQLQALTQPILEHTLTPWVRQTYPELCNRTAEGRGCLPCYSLIRRYRHGERQSHACHHDGHALVTVVVSLSSYNVDYRGGLYVSTGYGQRAYLPLAAGDAALHRSTLLHGVQVHDLLDRPHETERWSWIMWYRDSETCDNHSHEWFTACSNAGNPLCQQLHANTVGHGLSQEETTQQVLMLNLQAAEAGAGLAALKIARAYMHYLPSPLPYSPPKARKYYQLAMRSHNPDGYYGLADLLLRELRDMSTTKSPLEILQDSTRWPLILQCLERAAYLRHAFGSFNLGLAHIFGYGLDQIDMAVGVEWVIASGLPEGYGVAAEYYHSIGDIRQAEYYQRRATALGYGHPLRKTARDHTGSGGAGGVNLNLPWPLSIRGNLPPEF